MSDQGYKKRKIAEHELSPETLMMSYGYDPKLSEGSVKPPVFLTSTFVFNSAEDGEEFFHITAGRKEAPAGNAGGLVYSRFNHPNMEIVEDRLAVWEKAESSLVFSSGMGAISAVLLSFLRPGDVIAHSSPLYGGTETLIRRFLPQYNVETHDFVAGLGLDDTLAALHEAAKKGKVGMVFIETPANPTNAIIDFKALIGAVDAFEKAHGYRPLTVCDNTLMGPVFQQAIPHGFDLSVYSLTKYVGGHSDLVAGAVIGSRETLKPIKATRSALGLNLDPHSGWMIARSLETMSLRMERSADTGRKVAAWIAENPYAKAVVLHPDFITDAAYQETYRRQCSGPGSTFSFVVDAPKATMFKLINSLSIFKSAVSLGGNESLVCHPASTTHSGVPVELRDKAGVTDGLIRLSIGIEHPEDLIADLDYAFKAAVG
jgi:methionine-gamma-lyase